MKPYEKPRLVALSLSGNDMLCASCAIDVVGDNMNPTYKEIIDDLFGGVSPNFGTGEECTDITIDGYCKFGPTGELVFNS